MRYLAAIVVLAAAVYPGCFTDPPTSVDRPPLIHSFLPEDQQLDAFVGDTLNFWISASDPDNNTIRQHFIVGDSIVSTGSTWDYVVNDTGLVTVKCAVTDGIHTSRVTWQVRQMISVLHPPVITAFSPVETYPTMIIGNQLEFALRATDDDDDILAFHFSVDDSLVSTDDSFIYRARSQGDKHVTGVVTDGTFYASHEWFLTVTGIPDTIAPATVDITQVEAGDAPGELKLEWIAVGEDGMVGIASNYLVRTSPSPIVDEESWSRASERPGVPSPAPAGETMQMVITDMTPARYTYVAVRAMDDFGNVSSLGESPGGYTRGMRVTGRVMDSITGDPLAGAVVELAHFRTTTDLNGDFEFIELPPLTKTFFVSDDDLPGETGAYRDYKLTYTVVHEDYLPVYLIPYYQITTTDYADFMAFYRNMTERAGTPYPFDHHRWERPIDFYTKDFSVQGLDYKATIYQVADNIEAQAGFDFFDFVDAAPDVGVQCVYRSGITYDNYQVTEWTDDWYPKQAKIEFRTVYTPPGQVVFERVIAHELGHALGLNHSTDDSHLMVGGRAPATGMFTPDELAVLRTLHHIPRGTPLSAYLDD